VEKEKRSVVLENIKEANVINLNLKVINQEQEDIINLDI
jgi:hypothetical protein